VTIKFFSSNGLQILPGQMLICVIEFQLQILALWRFERDEPLTVDWTLHNVLEIPHGAALVQGYPTVLAHKSLCTS
jgi:hypothetical protein